MRIEEDIKLDFDDVLIRPIRSTLKSRSEVKLERTMKFKYSSRMWTGIPIISANLDTTGVFEIAEILMQEKMLTVIHKHYSIEDWKKFINTHNKDLIKNYVIPSIGASEKELNKLKEIMSLLDFSFITIDVANGYGEWLSQFISKVRKIFLDKIIIAGNVVSGDMTQELILAGADIIKIGIGSGALCTTRIKTGVGMPQISAIIDCSNYAHGLNGHIISDGGIVHSGDISKAFGAGADLVMVGSMFTGHKQSGGELIQKWEHSGYRWDIGSVVPCYLEKQYKKTYGMSSKTANDKYSGGLKKYRTAEGREVLVPFRGDIRETIQDIKGSIASTMTYIGAKKIKNIPKCCTFIRVKNTHNRYFEI